MRIQYFLTGIILWGLFGCATPAKQTKNLLEFPPQNISPFHEIQNVDFIDQSQGYCGPATLAMAMRWTGKDITVEEVAALVYTPGAQGSFQSDMISACRRQGLMAIPINNLSDLIIEVSANHPVIIFENLSFSWAPQWHYALIVGYDLNKKEIIMHSGHNAYARWDIEKFERSWMLGKYWGLVILPSGQLSATGEELSHVSAAVGLEQAKKQEEAQVSYLKILQKWPTSLVAMVGLANIYYQNGHRVESLRWLREAVRLHPNSSIAQHNLSVVESK